MKKVTRFLAFLLCASMLFGLLPTALANEVEVVYPVEGGNIYFNTEEGKVIGSDEQITAAEIPSEIDGVAVEYIDSSAFEARSNLESVTIPGSVIAIDAYAFARCEALSDLTIEDGVQELGLGAFLGCTSLTEVAIPKSVSCLGGAVFVDCSALTSITVDEENETYMADENSVLFSKDMVELVAFPESYEGAYVIPDGVEIIGYMAFNCCDLLTDITISESVQEIGDDAFSFCAGLIDVVIPENVVYIGEYAFLACDSMENITIMNPDCEIYPSSDTLGNRNLTTIHGAKDSTAHLYAEEFAYSFRAFACEEHNLQFVEARATDCTQEGCIEHWYCNACERYFADGEGSEELEADAVYIPREAHEFDENSKCVNCGCGLPFVINMSDSAGDGWNYCTIQVYEDSEMIAELTINEGAEATAAIDYFEDREYYFVWIEGGWPEECSFTITQGEEVLYDSTEHTLFGNMTFYAICEHEWIEASCTNPKTCEKCKITDGEIPEGHNYETVVKEETCTEEGYTTYTCTVCGDSYTDDYQLPTDHDYKEIVTPPTCSDRGYTTFTCTMCGDSYIENYIPAAHNLVDNVCTVCGASSPFVIEMYDSWGDGWNGNTLEVYKDGEYLTSLTFNNGEEAIATVDCDLGSEYCFVWIEGYNANECSFIITRNGETLCTIDDADALEDGQTVFAICEHIWIDATCEAPKTCEKCNITEGEALAHEYNEEDMCTACGTYIPFVVNMYDVWGNGWTGCSLQVYRDGELVQELTLESGAEATATVEYDPISEYAFVWSGALAADECGLTISRKEEVLYHTDSVGEYSDGVTLFAICEHILSDATCEDPQICEKCNLHVGTALGHTYTYKNVGETHIIGCEVCDYTEEAEHNFVAGDCICGEPKDPLANFDKNLVFSMNITAGAEMVVNYSFMAGAVSRYDDFYLVVEKDTADGTVVTTTYGTLDSHNSLGIMPHPVTGEPMMYNAAYTGINAKEMGDSFATTLYAIDATGKVYHGETTTSSIKDFLMGKLTDAASIPELKTMAVDMLKYGAAAQVNFDYGVENLVTADLTEEQLALGTQEIPDATDYASVTGSGANVNTNITVNSKVELRLSCIAAGQTNVKCVITDNEGKILAELATVNIGSVMYSAMYDNVGASQMRNVINATFYNEEGTAISKTVTWSVESYVAQTRARTDATETEIAMVDAMLTYGDAVAAYMDAK